MERTRAFSLVDKFSCTPWLCNWLTISSTKMNGWQRPDEIAPKNYRGGKAGWYHRLKWVLYMQRLLQGKWKSRGMQIFNNEVEWADWSNIVRWQSSAENSDADECTKYCCLWVPVVNHYDRECRPRRLPSVSINCAKKPNSPISVFGTISLPPACSIFPASTATFSQAK